MVLESQSGDGFASRQPEWKGWPFTIHSLKQYKRVPILVIFCYFLFLFLNSHPNGSKVVSYCGSDLHFLEQWVLLIC